MKKLRSDLVTKEVLMCIVIHNWYGHIRRWSSLYEKDTSVRCLAKSPINALRDNANNIFTNTYWTEFSQWRIIQIKTSLRMVAL